MNLLVQLSAFATSIIGRVQKRNQGKRLSLTKGNLRIYWQNQSGWLLDSDPDVHFRFARLDGPVMQGRARRVVSYSLVQMAISYPLVIILLYGIFFHNIRVPSVSL